MEAFIPDYTENISVLNPMFILGTFTKMDDDIKLNINPNHRGFKGDIVPNDFYERKKRTIDAYFDNIEEDLCYLPTYIEPAIENTKEHLERKNKKK